METNSGKNQDPMVDASGESHDQQSADLDMIAPLEELSDQGADTPIPNIHFRIRKYEFLPPEEDDWL